MEKFARLFGWLIVFIMGVLLSVTQTVFCADIIVDSYIISQLPAPGTPGRIVRVTDDVRGLWIDTGVSWKKTQPFVWVGDFNDDVQSAIDAANASGEFREVRLAGKSYSISTKLSYKSNVSLVGDARQASKLLFTGANTDGIELPATDANNIRIQNVKIEAQTNSTGRGIGALTGTMTRDLVLENFEIEKFLVGVHLEGNINVAIQRGRILGQGKATAGTVGIKTRYSTNGLLIERVYLSDLETGIDTMSGGSAANDVVLVSNMFEQIKTGITGSGYVTVIGGAFSPLNQALGERVITGFDGVTFLGSITLLDQNSTRVTDPALMRDYFNVPSDSFVLLNGVVGMQRGAVYAPAALSSNQSDFSIPDLTEIVVLSASTAGLEISGFTGGTGGGANKHGRRLRVLVLGTNAISFLHQSGYSQANNRFHSPTGASIVVQPNRAMELLWVQDNGYWAITEVPITRGSALTAPNMATVNNNYGSEEAGVINNLRTRLNELENRLKNTGIIQ